MAERGPPATPASAIAKLPRLASRMKNRDFASSAALIAGLATERAFHAHQVRLDWALRILAASAAGDRVMDRAALDRLLNQDFAQLRIDAQEDPLEQPFIGQVVTRHGEFRFVAGIYDQSAAFTDLIVSGVERLDEPSLAEPMGRALALLKLSDALVDRTGDELWALGPDAAVARINVPADPVLGQLASRVVFTVEDLQALHVDAALLEPFRLTEDDKERLATAAIGMSPLERKPLWRIGSDWIVLSPGAISTAVRACLIDAVVEQQLQAPMAVSMLAIQHNRLSECGFLEESRPPLAKLGDQPAADYVIELSAGRLCHVLATVDGFDDWPERGFGSERPCSAELEAAFARSVTEAREGAQGVEGFREGFTLWLAGSWGASRSMPIELLERYDDWPVILLEASDACILALGEAGKLEDIWRLDKLRRQLAADGFELHHPGTWLNLHAYWRENDHDLLPQRHALEPPMNLQFGLLDQAKIRAEAFRAWGRRALPHPRFGWGPMSRLERAPFSGDFEPIYASVDAVRRRRLIGATVDPTGVAWVEAIGGADHETVYQTWSTALQWWRHVLPAWAQWSGSSFPMVDLALSVDPQPTEVGTAVSDDQIDAAVQVWSEDNGVVRLHLGQDWHVGALRAENSSEIALAAGLMEAAAISAGQDLTREVALELVRDFAPPAVRHGHASLVERVIDALGAKGVIQPLRRLSYTAMSAEKYGSVWKVRPRDAPREIRGVDDCVALVRRCIDQDIADLRAMVAGFDRQGLVVAALRAQQAALMEMRTWETSARAMRAIHGVEQDLRYSLEQKKQVNSVIRSSAIIAEFAQADGALSGGLTVGHMDMEELQAKAMALFHVADMLPALIAGHQNPVLRISPSGDLQSDHRFSDITLKAAVVQLHAVDRTAADQNYDRSGARQSRTEPLDEALHAALEAEYGVPHVVLREFAMGAAVLAMNQGVDVIALRRSVLLDARARDEILASATLEPLINRLTLPARNGWSDIPPGGRAGDYDVSKFDRPRSLIGRPILALSAEEDPLLVLAPAVIERALVHNMDGALGGTLQSGFWSSDTMLQFSSRQGAQTGVEFNQAAADAVATQGLQTWVGRGMSWCLERKQSDELVRLGDVDVLAYSAADNLVWVIEAKDLKLCRTLGEVARRLASYQGKTNKGKPDSLLRHLRRVTFLRENADGLCKQLGATQTPRVCGLVIARSLQPMTQLTSAFYDDARVALLDRLEEIPWRTGW
ncbi:hypothetical protein OVA11_06035 [Caulobacter sp. SL161]|uniref:hypothetical protein n=1 Tax=Caulobacter sp. SL161 TaxID=2995156 RepID=UPI0022764A34|nr:hypothetical protein [Caulobacter sp. SL161]MCY1646648.1 hypothetical protein [Caulobacter sp. SL161]